MQKFIRRTLALLWVAGIAVSGGQAVAADVDINVRLPGAYPVPQPVYQQPAPVYVTPAPIIVRQQPVIVQREYQDDREWRCKNDKCKYKKAKKDKHGKHHGHDHDD